MNGGAWHPDSGALRFRGSVVPPRIGVPGILSGSAIRENRDEKRAFSDDLGTLDASCEEGGRAQTSSEGALLGCALGEAGLATSIAFPVHRDGDVHP